MSKCNNYHTGTLNQGEGDQKINLCLDCGNAWQEGRLLPECKVQAPDFRYPCDCDAKNDGIIKYSCQHCSDALAPMRTKLVIPADEPASAECPRLMSFDPRDGSDMPYPSEVMQFRKYHGVDAWLFNPWTGEKRDTRDIGSDPLGLLLVT